MRIRLWSCLAALMIWLHAAPSLACVVPPESLNDRSQTLVSTTPAISIARVVGIASGPGPRGSLYQFQLQSVETLKGDPPALFNLEGYLSKDVGGPGDFGGHRQTEFWAYDAGNTIQPGDCRAYGLFEMGQRYLVFHRNESHTRAYENLRSPDDLWLDVVKLLIREQHAR